MKSNMKPKIILALFFSMVSIQLFAQEFTQTVKGTIIDKEGAYPIPMVTVQIISTSDTVSTTTDLDGIFKVENVPVGRITLIANSIGYETSVLSNLELSTGKQLQVQIKMSEELVQLKGITINVNKSDKRNANNKFAGASTRKFTVEEAQRAPGALQDVSRMAANFAGVQSNNDASNDIVIRGNSPFFVLWRMEEVDIPNPNHFGSLGSTGGAVSMLNTNYLLDSDFMTGAFSAGYGNALSGVFDLKLRTGNTEKFEFLGQVGFNGFEGGIEGPISKKNNSSFYAGYRYSTLGLLGNIGLDIGTGTAVPYYQDANFNINLPTKKAGKFTLFGFGGRSNIEFKNSDRPEEERTDDFYSNGQDIVFETQTAALGLKHIIFLNDKSYVKTVVSETYMDNITNVDSITPDDNLQHLFGQNSRQATTSIHSYLNKKIDSKNLVRVGGIYALTSFRFTDSVYLARANEFFKLRNDKGTTSVAQFYANYQHKFSKKLKINAGIHTMYAALNNKIVPEPRVGIIYDPNKRWEFLASYGHHSQQAPLTILFTRAEQADGTGVLANTKLDFIKSHHVVLGARRALGEHAYFKTEAYYQYHYDVLSDLESSSFSILNFGSFDFTTPDYMTNEGVGRSYGLEATLERYLDNGYYFMGTGTLFQSEYKGSDNEWRNTAFNTQYITNAVAGKDIWLKDSKKGTKRRVTLDAKLNVSGGKYYTPLDEEASLAADNAVYMEEEAFSMKFKPYIRLDIKLGFVKNAKRVTEVFALDIQNLTNRENPYFRVYNRAENSVETINQIGIFPMLLYKVTF